MIKKPVFSSKRIAVAAVGAAFSLVMVTAAFFIKNLSLTFYVAAAIGLMLPLSQRYYKEAALSYVAVSAIGAIFTTVYILPFVLVTGLYTLAAVIAYEKNVKTVIVIPVAAAYSVLTFYIFYSLTGLLFIDLAKLKIASLGGTAEYILLNALYTAAFIVYHFLILWVYRYLKPIIAKIVKK